MKNRSHPERYIQRMQYLLEQLGNPDHGMKYIHITGTAGKGTVSTMIHNGLWAAGKRVGLFTSPYCVTVAENIQVNGRLIAPNEFADLVDTIRPVINKIYKQSASGGPALRPVHRSFSGGGSLGVGGPSYFEILLAIAFLYFQQQKCEWVVLEVGLGGRYDATNVIDAPIVSAITNIGLDHINTLGPTLRHIARDKAGIIKRGSVFFTTEHRRSLLRIFHKSCRARHASFMALKPYATAQETNQRLATAILEYLKVPHWAIKRGISQTKLPCRFEIVERRPMIILDGSHNTIKMLALLERLRELQYHRLIVVFGILADKDVTHITRMISAVADRVVLTQGTRALLYGRSWTPLSVLVKALCCSHQRPTISKQKSPLNALQLARSIAQPNDLILITGSFYLAGEIRKQWYSERMMLFRRNSFFK